MEKQLAFITSVTYVNSNTMKRGNALRYAENMFPHLHQYFVSSKSSKDFAGKQSTI